MTAFNTNGSEPVTWSVIASCCTCSIGTMCVMHCETYVVVPCFVFPEPFTNEVIAVLNSQHRVIWKVESDRQISNEVRHYFWVRTGVILQ